MWPFKKKPKSPVTLFDISDLIGRYIRQSGLRASVELKQHSVTQYISRGFDDPEETVFTTEHRLGKITDNLSRLQIITFAEHLKRENPQ
jgi:hypothetical protein